MPNKTFHTRYQIKRDSSTNWEKAVNFIPLSGEQIYYTDLNKIKVGNGITNVNSLPFLESITYTLSMSGNVITLTGSDGSTSPITLPVYNGGVSQ